MSAVWLVLISMLMPTAAAILFVFPIFVLMISNGITSRSQSNLNIEIYNTKS
ncbi:hypothetical protein PHDIMM138B_27485 [Phytobacter diazotrophicus]